MERVTDGLLHSLRTISVLVIEAMMMVGASNQSVDVGDVGSSGSTGGSVAGDGQVVGLLCMYVWLWYLLYS